MPVGDQQSSEMTYESNFERAQLPLKPAHIIQECETQREYGWHVLGRELLSPSRQVSHEVARAICPARTVGRKPHAIGQCAKFLRRDGDDVAYSVGEPFALLAAVF